MPYKDGKTEPRLGDTVLGDKVKGTVVGFSDSICKACKKQLNQHAAADGKAVGGACSAFAFKDGVTALVKSRAPWSPRRPLADVQTPFDPAGLVLLRRK